MIFTVVFEGTSVSCSSPRCVQRLLALGWRLADPDQTEALLRALEEEEDLRDPDAFVHSG